MHKRGEIGKQLGLHTGGQKLGHIMPKLEHKPKDRNSRYITKEIGTLSTRKHMRKSLGIEWKRQRNEAEKSQKLAYEDIEQISQIDRKNK